MRQPAHNARVPSYRVAYLSLSVLLGLLALAVIWWIWHPAEGGVEGPWTVEIIHKPPFASPTTNAVVRPTRSRASWGNKLQPGRVPTADAPKLSLQTVDGLQADSQFGHAVANAGDVNGDGWDDIVVGAFSEGRGGAVHVFYGSAHGIGPKPDWTYACSVPGADFGHQVEGVGDVNKDGYADFVVGATTYSGKVTKSGAAFLFLGSSNGPSAKPDWSMEGIHEGDKAGFSVAAAGDVNGDGYDDVLVGAYGQSHGEGPGVGPFSGQALLYAGGTNGLTAAPVWIGGGEMEHSKYGYCVHGAGDVNGDGYADLLVGSFDYSGRDRNMGRAYVYYGRPSWPSNSPDWTITGDHWDMELGASIGHGGDVNGDGFDDILVSSSVSNPEVNEGVVLVFNGSRDGLPDRPSWVFESNQEETGVGHSVSGVGDLNGDGYGDVLVSAYYGEQAGPGEMRDEGLAFLFYGSARGLGRKPDWTARGKQRDGGFGATVRGAGDFNGDGFQDLLIGHERYTGTLARQGRVWIHYGSREGLLRSSQWKPRKDVEGYSIRRINVRWPSTALGMILSAVPVLGMLLAMRWYYRQREKQAEALKTARATAQREERQRISQDLHDQLGADLTQIAIVSGALRQKAVEASSVPEGLGEIERNATQLVENLAEIVWLTKPSNDTLDRLIAFLESNTTQMLEKAGLRCILDIPDQVPGWTVEYSMRHDLVLAVKEAVHNAIQHARATRVRFSVGLQGNELMLSIADDGSGFATATKSDGGDGLGNMRSRLEKQGGTAEIRTGAEGTRVVFRVQLTGGEEGTRT